MTPFLHIYIIAIFGGATYGQFIFKPGPLVPASKGEIWPKAQHETRFNDFFTLQTTTFRFKNIGYSCNILKEALARYRNIIIFNNRHIKETYYPIKSCYELGNNHFVGFLTTLDVQLETSCNDDDYPNFEMIEEYVLNVTSTVQKLSSKTVWGILRGLETFSQLIYLTDDGSCMRIATSNIHDYPSFIHRGLLLDTSRHYHKKENILKLLDAMSYNKLNVFHWHITDDYSFPYESIVHPELSEKGAFHNKLMIYTQKDVREIQEYAWRRGIRVLAEFDTPGHTLSWGLANPDLLVKCINVPTLEWGPMDPTKNSTYEYVYALIDEIKSVFPESYIHLGGDEVDFSCWESNPEINQFMQENNIKTYQELEDYYVQRLVNYTDSLGMKSIVWEEVFTNGVKIPKSTIVNVWIYEGANETLADVTAAGYPAIISSYWYLDILATGGDWLKFYNANPLDFIGTEEQKKLVLGAEACMWSELVNEYNLEPRMWPRASAAAERFWSAPISSVTPAFDSAGAAAARLQEQTCRMNRRGIHAQPPTGPSTCF